MAKKTYRPVEKSSSPFSFSGNELDYLVSKDTFEEYKNSISHRLNILEESEKNRASELKSFFDEKIENYNHKNSVTKINRNIRMAIAFIAWLIPTAISLYALFK
ncbi:MULTISPECIES: hypothetical protein [Enterococcaceae]|uniref:hypothetical protein n=1 Tax=Enterococcaceae TaxID=81852 RepID=UPI001781D680|nr:MULTISPECIES: hypothetical protein [Enterococcaceae]MDT2745976.1 hypothetical protein [Vagococcus fluvialis]QOG32399.1 hypothetical protein EGM182_16945 [Enterococcus casseliflavus]